MVGPFGAPQWEGSMAIFRTREAAEELVADDPFVLNGVVRAWQIRLWNETYRDAPSLSLRRDLPPVWYHKSNKSRSRLTGIRVESPCGRPDTERLALRDLPRSPRPLPAADVPPV